ncbi:MAG: hypothetical protein M1114_02070 [Candidatus Dependentiae bacterium]|nr:hypothetical protein [Candidatus Dependentiae bacterium]
MNFFKNYPFFIFLLLNTFVLRGNDFTDEQWQKIKQYAPQRLVDKLEKAIALDYDEEYQKKYASQRLLIRERFAQKIAEKVDKAEQELLAQAKLSSEGIVQYDEIKKKVGSAISSQSFNGIWFKDENNQLFMKEDTESDLLQARVVAAVKKCMPLFDVDTIVIDNFSNVDNIEVGPIEGLNDYNSTVLTGNEIPCLLYNPNYIAHIHQQDLDAVIAHEFTHAKFRHGYHFDEYFDCHDAHHALKYYQEKQADIHASLTFASQTASFFRRELKIALRGIPLFNPDIKDNDPIKGYPSKDEHPSYLLRYIDALKIRNLLEAEQRWFTTEEANERYGSVYYERAFQKMAEQESQGKRFISAFAQSYKNFSTP